MRASTRPWPEISEFYSGLVRDHHWQVEPLLELVQYLATSPYASGLYAYTSHATLCLGRCANFTASDGELRVAFDPSTKAFTFTYTQSPADSLPWTRTCATEESLSVLRHVLHRRLGWFTGGVAT